MPKKYRVEITVTAAEDIESIFDYIAHQDPDAAIDWLREIERQIDSLERFPERCRVIPEAEALGREYRQLIYGHYRTVIRIHGSSVIILRVFHGARLLDMDALEE